MKHFLLLFSLLGIAFLVVSSCNKSDNAVVTGSPLGSWTRVIMDSDSTAFNGELRFYANHTFDFIVLDTATSHQNTHAGYTIESNVINFKGDDSCEGEGVYKFAADTARLTLVVVSESCWPRRKVLQGIWHRK